MNLWLNSIAYPVHSLGPGLRVAMWVTGCNRRCPGCISPELQDKTSGCTVPVEVLTKKLFSIELPIDGLTISGGEPMEQAGPLLLLLNNIREYRPDWNIILYSGYTLTDLGTMGGRPEQLAKAVDILIDGPYLANEPSKASITGSGNQVVHAMSPVGEAVRREIMAGGTLGMDLGLSGGDFSLLIGVPGGDQTGRTRGVDEFGQIHSTLDVSKKTT